MSGVSTRAVADDETGLRLDRWFRQHFPALPHGRLEKLLRTGQVRIDGHRAKGSTRLEAGQQIRVPPIETEPAPARGVPDARGVRELADAIVHRDEHVIVHEDDREAAAGLLVVEPRSVGLRVRHDRTSPYLLI